MQSVTIASERALLRSSNPFLPVKRQAPSSSRLKGHIKSAAFEKMPIIIEASLIGDLRHLIATKLYQIVDSYTVKPIENSKRLKVNLKIRAGKSFNIMHDVMEALDAAEFGRIIREN